MIYLTGAWGRHRAGTALAVLAEREAPGDAAAYVDAVRAAQLVADGLASADPPTRGAARRPIQAATETEEEAG